MTRSAATGRTAATNRVAVQDMKASLRFTKANSTKLITPSDLVTSASAFTVAAWAKIDDHTQYLALFDCGANGGFRIETSTLKQLSFAVWNGAVQSAAASAAYSINAWLPVVATFNAGTLKLYLNGSLVSTVTGKTMTTTTSAIGIGARATGYQNLGGSMSNAVFYNGYAFSASDVANYQNGVLPSGATFIYPLQEGAGTTAYDTSGNGNHGTITAGTYTADVPTKKRKEVNGNLVYNGDFEYAPPFVAAQTVNGRWLDGTAAGSTTKTVFDWAIISGGSSPTMSVSIDDAVRHSGTKSLKIVAGDAVGWAAVSKYTTLGTQTQIPCLPSTSYTLTGWVKTTAGGNGGATIRLRELNGTNGIVATTNSTALLGANDWTLLTVTVTTNAATRSLVPIMVYDPNNAGTAWFDDITLTPTTNTTRTAV